MKRGTKRGNSTLDTLTDTQSINKRMKRKTNGTSHQLTSTQCKEPLNSVDTNAHQQNIAYYKNLVTKLENQVQTLSVEIKEQQTQITGLITQMSFVTSWLENSVTPGQCSAAFKDFAAAVKRPAIAVERSAQESAVAAVYVDGQRRLNRSTNFIVSGLSPSSTRPDQNAVVDLCRQEFNELLDIVHCMRIGKLISGRVQPLLVILKTVDQAQRIIKAAKNLRQSTDPHISQYVYIAANLTKAESRAAYEVRCERRRAAERRNKKQQQAVTSQRVSVSDAAFSHQSQQSHPKKQHHQQYHQTSKSVIIAAGPQPTQHQQPHKPPLVKSANPVIAVEVHQPPSQFQQPQQPLQQPLHQTNQPRHLQWLQHQPSTLLRSADDQSLPSTFQHQHWQYSPSAPLQHLQYMQPPHPLLQSQLPMASSQYYPGSASLPNVQSLDASAPAFLASNGLPGTSATGPCGPDGFNNAPR